MYSLNFQELSKEWEIIIFRRACFNLKYWYLSQIIIHIKPSATIAFLFGAGELQNLTLYSWDLTLMKVTVNNLYFFKVMVKEKMFHDSLK